MLKKLKLEDPHTISILLIIFPPLAWYLMWKNQKYHSWFPKILLLYTLPTLGIYFIQLIVLLRSKIIQNGNVFPILVGITLYILQIGFYYILKKELHATKKIENTFVLLTIGILTIDTILPPIIYYVAVISSLLGR